MSDVVASVLNHIQEMNEYLWSTWTFFLLMGAGILFTLWSRFCQFRAVTHGVQVIRGVYDSPDDPGAINHFQALSAALSATVGLGNIGGVALAIAAGGPGALFWMWVTGFLGMALKTVEVTLSMMYRNTDDPNNPHGGAMWVIDKALGDKGLALKSIGKLLGCFFAVTCLISTMTGGNMFQVWNVAELTETYFDVPRVVTGIVMAVLTGLVIVGGIKRIGNVAGRLVPFMCVLYLISGLTVLAMHIDEIPGMFSLVFRSAFSPLEAQGAFLGGTMWFAFSVGLRRALFSNEAGQGSAPIAHAAAKTDEPAREGVVGGLEPFIDTICICTLTALVILLTGTWSREPVGEFAGEVRLERKNPDSFVWTVQAETSVEALPKLEKLGPWSLGDQFFVLAQVPDNTNKLTGSNFVPVKGSISSTVTTTHEVPSGDLFLTWLEVSLSPADWEQPPQELVLVDKQIYREFTGASLTAHAFDREFAGLGKWLVTLAAWLFALSSMISWSYYGEQSTIYLVGNAGVLPYKFVFLFLAVAAPIAIVETSELEAVMDYGTGWMLWANMPIVLLMGFLAIRCLDDYFRRLRAGEFHAHAAPPIVDVAEGRDVE